MSESSRQEKLTPWFSGDQKPVRVGVYERRMGALSIVRYSHWNGKKWGASCDTVKDAARHPCRSPETASWFQHEQWRGLTRSALSASRGEQPTVKAEGQSQ